MSTWDSNRMAERAERTEQQDKRFIDKTLPDMLMGDTPTGIDATLAERGTRYGQFEDHAVIAQGLQDVMRGVRGGAAWAAMAPDQRQALTVIADKIARMLNGDPAYRDNWHDIVGYAKLVDDRMARDEHDAKLAAAVP